MTLRTFLNTTTGIKGVNTVGKGGPKIINVDPGAKTPPLEVTEEDLAKMRATGWFKIAKATKEDETVQATHAPYQAPSAPELSEAEKLLAGIEDGGMDDDGDDEDQGDQDDDDHDDDDTDTEGKGDGDDFDAMDDEALRAFITDRDGKAPHHMLKREKLLALARTEAADSEGV